MALCNIRLVSCEKCDCVEVVRCKDCCCYNQETLCCTFWPDVGYRHPDHYCAEGERRTDYAAQEEKPHAGTDRGQT